MAASRPFPSHTKNPAGPSGIRSLELVCIDEKQWVAQVANVPNVAYPFLGATLQEQADAVMQLSELMQAGQQSLLEGIGRVLDVGNQELEVVVDQLFNLNDTLRYAALAEPVYTAEDCLLEEVEAAGGALMEALLL